MAKPKVPGTKSNLYIVIDNWSRMIKPFKVFETVGAAKEFIKQQYLMPHKVKIVECSVHWQIAPVFEGETD